MHTKAQIGGGSRSPFIGQFDSSLPVTSILRSEPVIASNPVAKIIMSKSKAVSSTMSPVLVNRSIGVSRTLMSVTLSLLYVL